MSKLRGLAASGLIGEAAQQAVPAVQAWVVI